MCTAFQKSITTPLPGFVIPLLVGVTTGVGVATGFASVGLQAYQQAQANKQVEEQEEILKLQKRLTLYQLKQFEEQEKVEKENDMFKTPTNIRMSAMTTRSMAQAANMQRSISNSNLLSNTGLGPIQRGNIVGSGAPIYRAPTHASLASSSASSAGSLDLFRADPRRLQPISPYTPVQNFDLADGGVLPRTGSRQSLFGSTESLSRQHGSFARNLQQRYQVPINMSDEFEMTYRGPARINPTAQDHYTSPQLYTNKRKLSPPTRPPGAVKRMAPPPPSAPSSHFYEYPLDIPPEPQFALPPRPTTSFLRTIRSIPRRIRSMVPARGSAALGENVPLLTHDDASVFSGVPGNVAGDVPPKLSLGQYLNKHKRRIAAIAAGTIGGAALVGGTIAGILGGGTKREKTMQRNESRGMFEQLSSGTGRQGGGGGVWWWWRWWFREIPANPSCSQTLWVIWIR